jgi:hypothetical protein
VAQHCRDGCDETKGCAWWFRPRDQATGRPVMWSVECPNRRGGSRCRRLVRSMPGWASSRANADARSWTSTVRDGVHDDQTRCASSIPRTTPGCRACEISLTATRAPSPRPRSGSSCSPIGGRRALVLGAFSPVTRLARQCRRKFGRREGKTARSTRRP